MVDFSNYIESIKLITKNGMDVLRIEHEGSGDEIFIVEKFDDNSSNKVLPTNFCTLVGIRIDTFLFRNSGQSVNPNFINSLISYIQDSTVERVEFSNNLRWSKYSSAR